MYPEIYPEIGKVYDNGMNFLGRRVIDGDNGNEYIMVKFAYNQFLRKGEAVTWDEDFIATSAVGVFQNGILAADVNTLDLSSGEYYYAFVVTKSPAVDVSYGGAVAAASDVTNALFTPVKLATGTYYDGLLKEASVARTLTGTLAPVDDETVTGTSTLFTTELSVGDVVEMATDTSAKQYGVVAKITNAVAMTVVGTLANVSAAAAATVVKSNKGGYLGAITGNGTVGYSDEYENTTYLGTLATSTTTATLTSDYSALKLFRIGDFITVVPSGTVTDAEVRYISAITNADTFTINAAFTTALSGHSYTVKRKVVNCRMGM